MKFPRRQYLQKLIAKMNNDRGKIITRVRRCEKSFLLFIRYLRENCVKGDQIIALELAEIGAVKYRNPIELDQYVRKQIVDKTKLCRAI